MNFYGQEIPLIEEHLKIPENGIYPFTLWGNTRELIFGKEMIEEFLSRTEGFQSHVNLIRKINYSRNP